METTSFVKAIPNNKMDSESLNSNEITSENDVENGLMDTPSSIQGIRQTMVLDKSLKGLWAVCVLDVAEPVLSLGGMFAFNLSPMGLQAESGSWKEARIPNILMMQAHILQVIMSLYLFLPLWMKIFSNLNMSTWLCGYQILSLAFIGIKTYVVTCSFKILETQWKDTVTNVDISSLMFLTFIFIALRIINYTAVLKAQTGRIISV